MDNSNVFDLDTCIKQIQDNLKSCTKNFMKIGFFLWTVKYFELYKERNFSSILDFSQLFFGFSKSATYSFIKICEIYSARDENNLPSSILAEEYKYFSSSQLSEMLGLSEKERKEVTSDMTIKEIRKQIKDKKSLEETSTALGLEEEFSVSTESEKYFGFEELPYKNNFNFDSDALTNLKCLSYERTLKVVTEAADYSAAFASVVEYLNKKDYAIRICLYRLEK